MPQKEPDNKRVLQFSNCRTHLLPGSFCHKTVTEPVYDKCLHQTETCPQIYTVYKLTVFYMIETLVFQRLNLLLPILLK